VTDLHYAEQKANRLDYHGEVMSILQNLLLLNDKYKRQGYTVRLIFLGDVIDSSTNNVEEAMRCVDIFRYITGEFDAVYSVLGNHEETYITNNPFWYLISSLDDEALSKVPRALQPKSVVPCIRVPDVLKDGNVTFYFNHYGVAPKVPVAGEVSIGLFHQNVGSNDICKMWGTFDNVEEASYVQMYNYCFFGHMHLAYGKYFLNEAETCLCEWLGSCGRTNVVEVETAPLSVNIPAVLITDGSFSSIDSNMVERKGPRECIDYTKVELMRGLREEATAIKDAIPRGLRSDTLFTSIQDAADAAGVGILTKLLGGSYEALLEDYKQDLKQLTDTSEAISMEG